MIFASLSALTAIQTDFQGTTFGLSATFSAEEFFPNFGRITTRRFHFPFPKASKHNCLIRSCFCVCEYSLSTATQTLLELLDFQNLALFLKSRSPSELCVYDCVKTVRQGHPRVIIN